METTLEKPTSNNFIVALSSTIALAAAMSVVGTVTLGLRRNGWDDFRRWFSWSNNHLYQQRRKNQEYLLHQLLKRCLEYLNRGEEENLVQLRMDNDSLQILIQQRPEDISIVGIAAGHSHLVLRLRNQLDSIPSFSYVAVDLEYQVEKMEVWLEEEDFSSTTFCFVADASGGLGIDILNTLLSSQPAKNDCLVLNQPLWIYTLAIYVQQNFHLLIHKNEEKILQLICFLVRLEERRVRKDIGSAQTLIIFLPTQSTTAPLLHLFYKAFPSHRHLFIYNGACASTAYSLNQRKIMSPNNDLFTLTTLPISNLYAKSLGPKLQEQLAKLDFVTSGAVETWISSVDAFLKLKAVDNEYVPFIFNCKYLLDETLTTTTSVAGGDNGLKTDIQVRHLYIINVLQYMLGSSNKSGRSISSSSPIVKQAFSLLMQHYSNIPDKSVVPPAQRTVIEAAVFCHKSILIGDKTLVDTVQPQTHWTLRAMKKISACACCIAQEEEEEEEEEDNQEKDERVEKKSKVISATFSSSTAKINTSKEIKFVDGRAKFAFDPTSFAPGKI